LNSSAEVSILILQTLLTIVSLHLGALEFITVEDVSPLTEIAHQQPLVLDIFSLAWSNASTGLSEVPAVRASINRIVPMLLNSFRDTDTVTFLAFIGDTLTRLPPEVRFYVLAKFRPSTKPLVGCT
jgi:Neurochondrin